MQTKVRATAATIFSRVSAPPPPLIIENPLIDLVGAVDVDRKCFNVVEVEERNAGSGEPPGAALGTRDRSSDFAADGRQFVDEEIGGRAGADTDDLAARHMVDRGARDRALQFVLVRHRPSRQGTRDDSGRDRASRACRVQCTAGCADGDRTIQNARGRTSQ